MRFINNNIVCGREEKVHNINKNDIPYDINDMYILAR